MCHLMRKPLHSIPPSPPPPPRMPDRTRIALLFSVATHEKCFKCTAGMACMQALVVAARAEKSSTVQRSYAQAAATVAKFSSEARVAKLVEEAVAMYTTPGDVSPAGPLLHPTPPFPLFPDPTLPLAVIHPCLTLFFNPIHVSLHPLPDSAQTVLQHKPA